MARKLSPVLLDALKAEEPPPDRIISLLEITAHFGVLRFVNDTEPYTVNGYTYSPLPMDNEDSPHDGGIPELVMRPRNKLPYLPFRGSCRMALVLSTTKEVDNILEFKIHYDGKLIHMYLPENPDEPFPLQHDLD